VATASLGFVSRLWLAWLCFFKILFDGSFAFRVNQLTSGRALPSGDDAPASSEPRAPREARRPDRGEPVPTSDAPTRRAGEVDGADTLREPSPSADTDPGEPPSMVQIAPPRRGKRPEQSTTLRSRPAPRLDGASRASSSGEEEDAQAQGLRREGALLLLELLQREGRLVDFLEQDVQSFSDEDVGVAARVVHEGCRKSLRAHLEVEPIRSEAEGATLTLDAGYDARAVKLVGDVRGSAPYRGSLRHRGWRAKELRLPEPVDGHDASVLAMAEVEL
jgi:hypothetical protein